MTSTETDCLQIPITPEIRDYYGDYLPLGAKYITVNHPPGEKFEYVGFRQVTPEDNGMYFVLKSAFLKLESKAKIAEITEESLIHGYTRIILRKVDKAEDPPLRLKDLMADRFYKVSWNGDTDYILCKLSCLDGDGDYIVLFINSLGLCFSLTYSAECSVPLLNVQEVKIEV